MEDIIVEINLDIKKYKEVLNSKNYLEIVIGIEELVDKYKSVLSDIDKGNENVWNYKVTDLEEILNKLLTYKSFLLEEYYKKNYIDITIEESLDNIMKKIKEDGLFTEDKLEKVIYHFDAVKKILNE